MTKRSRDKPTVTTEASSRLGHHPLAALAALKLEISSADSPPPSAESPEVTTPAGSTYTNKVVVSRETKGRGGKTITRVRGVAADQRERVAAAMKKALGCGASVEGDDVLLLGSVLDRAAKWLEDDGARRVVRSG